MTKLVIVQSGEFYCDMCYADVKGETDNDFSMHVQMEVPRGTCTCCGAVVDNHEIVDYAV